MAAMNDPAAPQFTHVDPHGDLRMVDVSGKNATERVATASACMTIAPHALDAILSGALAKGEALAAARVAGILAAKRTAELIPLCHPLPLEWVRIHFARQGPQTLLIVGTAKTTAPTGVEMEALTAVSTAALTIYDMAKSADRGMQIGPIRLEHKAGGRSGEFRAPPP
jgi:cyclic pyranopterin phosphate synthase